MVFLLSTCLCARLNWGRELSVLCSRVEEHYWLYTQRWIWPHCAGDEKQTGCVQVAEKSSRSAGSKPLALVSHLFTLLDYHSTSSSPNTGPNSPIEPLLELLKARLGEKSQKHGSEGQVLIRVH